MDANTLNDRQSETAMEPTRQDKASAGEILLIDLNLLDNNPYQARTERDQAKAAELRMSIAAQGQMQPILVRRVGARWQIIYGHGRVEALRQLRDEASNEADRRRFASARAEERLSVSDQQMLVLSLVENIHREDISPTDCAAALVRLKQLLLPGSQSAEAIAEEVNMTPEQVRRLLRLHVAPQVIKDAVCKGMEIPIEAIAKETPAGASTQTTKRLRLEVSSALEFAKLYRYWTGHPAPEVLRTKLTPDERMAAVIGRALKEEWSVRKVQAVVAKLTQGEEEPTRVAGGSSVQGECEEAGDIPFPAFRNDRGTESRAKVRAQADLGSARWPSSRARGKLLCRVGPRLARVPSSLEGPLLRMERAAKSTTGEPESAAEWPTCRKGEACWAVASWAGQRRRPIHSSS